MIKFNNIYIEKQAFAHTNTKKILKSVSYNNLIEINHYKDIFCRPKQNTLLQKKYQNLILALRKDNFLYKGASVCQDFGNSNFYYTSCVMNCICNCEYCYLKGMYPSSHLVVFINLEDYFKYLEKYLANKKLYLCVSYDTDLFPLENLLFYIKKWCNFARKNQNLKIEIRTKCKNLNIWNYKTSENIIFAFSLSPDEIIKNYEHKTSFLDARFENINTAISNNFNVRLCFDPIIYTKNWKNIYIKFLNKCYENINFNKIYDISIGTFRISSSYLKKMRVNDKNSSIVNFPFTNINGYYQYPINIQKEMEQFLIDSLTKKIDNKRIYLWK